MVNNFTNINKTNTITSHLKSLNTKQTKTWHMPMEIQVLTWDRHIMYQYMAMPCQYLQLHVYNYYNNRSVLWVRGYLYTGNYFVVVIVYGSWIYNYVCNQCLLPLKLWVRTPFMARCARYNIMWKSLSVICDRSVVFSGYTNKTYHHDITEILLKVALNTITLTLKNMFLLHF